MDYLDYIFRFNNDRTGIMSRYTKSETKAHIPHIVAGYKMVDVARWAFCLPNGPYYEKAPLEEIEFEEGYRRIFHGAFFGCDKLRRISFPSTLDTLYGDPFEGAPNIEEIVFPNGNEHFVFEDGKLMSADGTKVYFTRKDGGK